MTITLGGERYAEQSIYDDDFITDDDMDLSPLDDDYVPEEYRDEDE